MRSTAPVFIVSTGRCGSTLLSEILGDHPDVLSVSELLALLAGQRRRQHHRHPVRAQPVQQPPQQHLHIRVVGVRLVHDERLAGQRQQPTEARLKTATWIADFYNTKRRHSTAGGKPPVEFERIIQETRARTDQEGRAA